MKIVSVPGLNGLGVTRGVENACGKVFEESYEQIKLNNEDISEQLNQILDKSKKYFKEVEKICFFGGDHSISFPLVENFFNEFGLDSKLLVFDAHPDLMDPMVEPTHEEWLRAVVEIGFNPRNILIVGVRRNSKNVDESEINYAKEKGIGIIYSDEFDLKIGEILSFVEVGDIYCSFDIDVFDSSLVSCTGYPEKQGLDEAQVFEILERLKDKVNFLDLVEVNFEKEQCKNSLNVKKLVWKILKTFS